MWIQKLNTHKLSLVHFSHRWKEEEIGVSEWAKDFPGNYYRFGKLSSYGRAVYPEVNLQGTEFFSQSCPFIAVSTYEGPNLEDEPTLDEVIGSGLNKVYCHWGQVHMSLYYYPEDGRLAQYVDWFDGFVPVEEQYPGVKDIPFPTLSYRQCCIIANKDK